MSQQAEHYAQLIEKIFGTKTATFDPQKTNTNNFIGALANKSNFSEFTNAFTARLQRLADAIKANPQLAPSVIRAVNEIADSSNAEGAFAELSAVDFFIEAPLTSALKIDADVTLPAANTLASEMGYQFANVDLKLLSFDLYLDVKLLSAKADKILERMEAEIVRKKGLKDFHVMHSFDRHMPYKVFQDKRKDLALELSGFIDTPGKPRSFRSTVIPELSYEFNWGGGVMISASGYSPEEHAQNQHQLLFHHAKKFHRSAPSAIVFSHFPWSGERSFLMNGTAETFFREFSNQFFLGYSSSTELAKAFNSDFTTPISADEVSTHLSVLIFLDDHSILAKDPNISNVTGYFMINPRAKNSIEGTALATYLSQRMTRL